MKKRLLSILLILALVLAVLPQTALMAEPECAHEHTAPLYQSFKNTRGDFCIMLWNMAGRPAPAITSETFDDLSDADECYEAALWVIGQNIMNGYSDTEFAPDDAMLRSQAVTFLWRYAGMPTPENTNNPFIDLRAGAFYVRAVEWAYGADWIELSTDGRHFRPDESFEELLLEGAVCEDCGKVIETAKVTVSEPITAAGTYGDNLKWKLCNGVLTITGSGEMKDLADDEQAPWYDYCSQIEQISLPEGLTSIGVGAFEGCCYLFGIEIPEGVTRIGAGAFYGCSAMMKISFPDSVTCIEDAAFCSCQLLREPMLPKNLERLGYGVFIDTAFSNDEKNWKNGILYLDGWVIESKRSIETIQIRPGTRGIAGAAFWNCSYPTSVTIPAGVIFIGEWAFGDCYCLQKVTIPDSVTSIGAWAFCGCVNLKQVEIPQSVSEIGVYAFCDCVRLSKIVITNKECSIRPGGEYPEGTLGDPEIMTIYSYAGSTAEDFASKYGYRFTALSEKVPFIDVPAAAFYEDPVAWAVENEITKGVDESHFGPTKACTRGQVVTFLWRAAGCPAPAVTTASTFTDIKPGAFYELAVAWAVQQGITNGLSADKFGPDATCTRGQIVTFLWRFREKAEPESTKTAFTDVPDSAFYAKAVAWAVENGITNGLSNDKFGPGNVCTRGQVVTFLSRATAEK